jgi:signal transduction histidine kinase
MLGWHLVYTEQIVRAFRSNTETLTRMYSEVQRGLTTPTPAAADQALNRLQETIIESGVPMVLTGARDTVLSAQNLPFEADPLTPEGQESLREYVRQLDLLNAPIGYLGQTVHVGDPPQFQRLRWVPWFQVAGLLLIFLTGTAVVRSQRIAEADRAWTSMARELAHQLGTPISSLKGWLEVLSLPEAERPREIEDGEVAAEIGEDVARLERVSRRFELIGRKTPLEDLRVEALVGGVERYLSARLPRLGPGVQLSVAIEEGLPPVVGNEVLLSWALENVLKNALDALAGRAGSITVSAGHGDPGWVRLEVRDSGPGVSPEVRDRLFEAGTTTKSGGWGVGLTLARRIVEQIHGGRLELAATGPEGTVFRLVLPARARPS